MNMTEPEVEVLLLKALEKHRAELGKDLTKTLRLTMKPLVDDVADINKTLYGNGKSGLEAEFNTHKTKVKTVAWIVGGTASVVWTSVAAYFGYR
jgi:hypothetical protein